ncbi:hypothetical protein BGZ63DRAFT_475876 [Mariannaea sp. PMI_226]|nr:hypothetical protein BGZ63DRAFT_475876 [Mariannaea sp. PMI_226]
MLPLATRLYVAKYESTVRESSRASLASSILEYRKENGRTYPTFQDGKYHFPNDQTENERLDLQHHIFYITLNGKLGLSPPHEPNQKLEGAPPNVKFKIDDFEEEWTYAQPFEYIHSRMTNSSISNWEEYIQKCFDNPAPGGYAELQYFGLPLSDDDTLTSKHALHKAIELLEEAAAGFGRPFIDLKSLKPLLQKAGFQEGIDYHYNDLQGFLMAALTRALGWRAEEADALALEAKKDMSDKGVHAYWPMVVVTGRKPNGKDSAGED